MQAEASVNNEIFDFSLFNDIEDRKLRAFNRLQTYHNIRDSISTERGRDYVEQFDDQGIKDMMTMRLVINQFGRDAVTKHLKQETEGYVHND